MITYCTYCGEPKGEKLSCCSEVHFEECDDLEYEHMAVTGKSLEDTRSDFDKFVERMEKTRSENENDY